MSTFSWVYKPYTFWDPVPPSQKKSTHQHCLSAKNPHHNNKNQAKNLKVYGKNIDFQTHPLPLKVYGVYTHENVDIYGLSLIHKDVLINCSDSDNYGTTGKKSWNLNNAPFSQYQVVST